MDKYTSNFVIQCMHVDVISVLIHAIHVPNTLLHLIFENEL